MVSQLYLISFLKFFLLCATLVLGFDHMRASVFLLESKVSEIIFVQTHSPCHTMFWDFKFVRERLHISFMISVNCVVAKFIPAQSVVRVNFSKLERSVLKHIL